MVFISLPQLHDPKIVESNPMLSVRWAVVALKTDHVVVGRWQLAFGGRLELAVDPSLPKTLCCGRKC